MKLRGGEFSTGTTGNFQSELTSPASLIASASTAALNLSRLPSAAETKASATPSPATPNTTNPHPNSATGSTQSGAGRELRRKHLRLNILTVSYASSGPSKTTPITTIAEETKIPSKHKLLQYCRSALMRLSIAPESSGGMVKADSTTTSRLRQAKSYGPCQIGAPFTDANACRIDFIRRRLQSEIWTAPPAVDPRACTPGQVWFCHHVWPRTGLWSSCLSRWPVATLGFPLER
jgi:hypothetical protein